MAFVSASPGALTLTIDLEVTRMRPTWNVDRERDAEAWAKRADTEALAAMLASKRGTTYYLAALAEWQRRHPNASHAYHSVSEPHCMCGHSIISHDPAHEGIPCRIRSCSCSAFAQRDEAEAIVADFFAFQAAACTGRPDCTCGRPADHPVHN